MVGWGWESCSKLRSTELWVSCIWKAFNLTHAIQLYKENNHTYNKQHITQPTSSRLIRIADYGCGYGRNTLECAQFIVSEILELDEEDNRPVLKEETTPPPCELINAELQYFFVDLPDNDFNSLFRMLHSPDCPALFRRLKFFATGVPGSFYGRVLPEGSVDFATNTFNTLAFPGLMPLNCLIVVFVIKIWTHVKLFSYFASYPVS